MPAPLWAQANQAPAHSAPKAVESATAAPVPVAAATPEAASEAEPETKTEAEAEPKGDRRAPLLEKFILATWRLRDITQKSIPGLLEYWKVEMTALFEPFKACDSYYPKDALPTSVDEVNAIVADAQKALSDYLASEEAALGTLPFELTDAAPRPPAVTSPLSSHLCQPLIWDQKNEEGEAVLSGNSSPGAMPSFLGDLSRKTPTSPFTSSEVKKWLGWNANLRKLARLHAQVWGLKTKEVPPTLPDFSVPENVGIKLQAILTETDREKSRQAVLANQMLTSGLLPGYSPQFVACSEKEKLCSDAGVPTTSTGYCFCDGKEKDARLLDEEIVATLQAREEKNSQVSHGAYLNAIRRLGIKGLLTELATANSFLPEKERRAIPDACVRADDIKEYVWQYQRNSEVGYRQWWIQRFNQAVDELVQSYAEGSRQIPLPDVETAYPIYATAQALASSAILALSRATLMAGMTVDEEAVLENEKKEALVQMGAYPFDAHLSQDQAPFAQILGDKLRTWAVLVQQEWINLEEKDWAQRQQIAEKMVSQVVRYAMEDALETYVMLFALNNEKLNAPALQATWQQSFRLQWRQTIASPEFAKEWDAMAEKITQAFLDSEVWQKQFAADSLSDEETELRLNDLMPRVQEASLTDIPEARASSTLPDAYGKGTQKPVFLLTPEKADHHLALAKGLSALARSKRKELIEKLSQMPGYNDPNWLARNFVQTVTLPDGTQKRTTVRSVEALADAVLAKFEETARADAERDRDLRATERKAALDEVKSWLLKETRSAEIAYSDARKRVALRLQEKYLAPLRKAKSSTREEKAWREYVERTWKEVSALEIGITEGAKERGELFAREAEGTRQNQLPKVREVFEQATEREGELISGRIFAVLKEDKKPGERFVAYCLGLKDRSKDENCQKWLFPLQEENRGVLQAFYETRAMEVTQVQVTSFLESFGETGLLYPGKANAGSLYEGAEDEMAVENAIFQADTVAEELFTGWYGYLYPQSEEGEQARTLIDAFLVGVSQAAHKKENAGLTAEALLVRMGARKAWDAQGWTKKWNARVERAGKAISEALENPTEEKLSGVFFVFQALVGKEYALLLIAPPEQTESLARNRTAEVMAESITPNFYAFRSLVLDHIETLSIAQPDPERALKEAKKELLNLEFQLKDLEEAKRFDADVMTRIGERARHFKLVAARAEHQINAYVGLERLLQIYFPEHTVTKQLATASRDSSVSAIWNAYYADQFVNSREDAEGKALSMTPAEVLVDLNTIAKEATGMLAEVSFARAESYLEDVSLYFTALKEGAAAENAQAQLDRLLEADTASLRSQSPAVIAYLEQGTALPGNLRLIVDRLGALLTASRREEKEWLTSILQGQRLDGITWEGVANGWLEKAEVLQKDLKTAQENAKAEAHASVWVPSVLRARYGALVQSSASLLFHPAVSFGPVLDKEGELTVWLNTAPYQAFETRSEVAEKKEAEEKTKTERAEGDKAEKEENNEEQKKKLSEVSPVLMAEALIRVAQEEFATDVRAEMFGKLVEGPTVFQGLLDSDVNTRLATVYALRQLQKKEAYEQLKIYFRNYAQKIYEEQFPEALENDDSDTPIAQKIGRWFQETKNEISGASSTLFSRALKALSSVPPSQALPETTQKISTDSGSQPPESVENSNAAKKTPTFLFSEEDTEERLDYETWGEELQSVVSLWRDVREEETTANQIIVGEELFALFFGFLPYRLNEGRVELPQEGQELALDKGYTEFLMMSVDQRRSIIDEVVARFDREVQRQAAETLIAYQKERREKQRLGLSAPARLTLEVRPFAPGSSVSFVPNARRVTDRTRFVRFMAEYFLPYAPTAQDKELAQWEKQLNESAAQGRTAFERDAQLFSYEWYPIGVPTTSGERFAKWTLDLAENVSARSAFTARSGNASGKHIWNTHQSLEAWRESSEYQQLEKLIALFDRNAEASASAQTYPFMLALLNWKKNHYGTSRALTGPQPIEQALTNTDTAALLPALIDVMGLNLKDFAGWEKLTDDAEEIVHTIIAQERRFALVGVGERRFANTAVSSTVSENPDWGPDYETRFFPVFPAQRTEFLPAETFEDYTAMLEKPATYLRYQVNTSDRGSRPLYKQLMSVQGRMVGVGEIQSGSPIRRHSFDQHQNAWGSYTFGGNDHLDTRGAQGLLQRARLAGLEGVGESELRRVVQAREQYIDFVDKVSQLVDKYPFEETRKAQVEGNSILLNAGGFAKKWGSRLSRGWLISPAGQDQLDAMLESYKRQTNYSGEITLPSSYPGSEQIAAAIWQAGLMTKSRVESGLTASQKADRQKLLGLIDSYFAGEVQKIDYRRGTAVVADNILPRLDKLCQVAWVKDTQSDADFKKVKDLIKESQILYYENLAVFLNEFLPEGDNNQTYRKLLELQAEKTRIRQTWEKAETVVHALFGIMLLQLFAGETALGGAAVSQSVKQWVTAGAGVLFNIYFGITLYDEMAEDYWASEGRLEFLRGNRDTVIADVMPLVSDEKGMDVDLVESDMLSRQQSKLRWFSRLWLGAMTFQGLGLAQKVLRGGTGMVMTRVRPQWMMARRLKSYAKQLGLDPQGLMKMSETEAVARIRQATLDKLEGVLGAAQKGDGFILSPKMAEALRNDIRAQLKGISSELKLDRKTLKPLELSGGRAVTPNILDRRREIQPVIDKLANIDRQLLQKRFVSRDDLALMFTGKDVPILPGMGAPVFRHMPGWLPFTGMPASVFALGPQTAKLNKIYRVMEAEKNASNVLSFHLVGAWREKYDIRLFQMAETFSKELQHVRALRVGRVAEETKQLEQLLAQKQITPARFDALKKKLADKAAADRSDVEELLAAIIDTHHPLYLRFATPSQKAINVTIAEEEGSVVGSRLFSLGRSGQANAVSEPMQEMARELRLIADASGIQADNQLLRAIARRDYHKLAKEFMSPARVIIAKEQQRSEDEIPELTIAGSQARSVPLITQSPKPAAESPLAREGEMSALLPEKARETGVRWIAEDYGIELNRVMALAVKNESGGADDILSLLRSRLTSTDLQAAYGESLVAGISASEARAYQIAIAYTRDMEIAAEVGRQQGAARAQGIFEQFYQMRLKDLSRVLNQPPSLAEAKATLGMDPRAKKWTQTEVAVRRGELEGRVDQDLLKRAEKRLHDYAPDSRRLMTLEEYGVVTDVSPEYWDVPEVLRTITQGMDISISRHWLGRPLEPTEAVRLSDLFRGRTDTLIGAENLLAASSLDEQGIRAAARRWERELAPRANRSSAEVRAQLQKYELELPENERVFEAALERVRAAERLLIEQSKKGPLSRALPTPSGQTAARELAPDAIRAPLPKKIPTALEEEARFLDLNAAAAHPSVQAQAGGAQSAVSRVAQQGFSRTQVLVLEEEIQTQAVRHIDEHWARVLQATEALQKAQAAGRLRAEEGNELLQSLLAHYGSVESSIHMRMSVATALEVSRRFLKVHGVRFAETSLRDFRFVTNDYARAITQVGQLLDSEESALYRRHRQALKAWTTLYALQDKWFEPNEPSPRSGRGVEGLVLRGPFQLPLEALLHDAILTNSTLLSFLLSGEENGGGPEALVLQHLFADQVPAGSLRSALLHKNWDGDRIMMELELRLTEWEGQEGETLQVLRHKVGRALDRLVASGYTFRSLSSPEEILESGLEGDDDSAEAPAP